MLLHDREDSQASPFAASCLAFAPVGCLSHWPLHVMQPHLNEAFDQAHTTLLRLADAHLRHEYRANHTLDAPALVAEAYARLQPQYALHWNNTAHLKAICSTTMRAILVDHARQRMAMKRGGGQFRVTLHEDRLASPQYILELDEALDRLGRVNLEALRIVEARFFGGYSTEEAADALGLSYPTARRRWAFAKGWLAHELETW